MLPTHAMWISWIFALVLMSIPCSRYISHVVDVYPMHTWAIRPLHMLPCVAVSIGADSPTFCARNRSNKVEESMLMHVATQASVQCMTMHVADCLVSNAIQPSGSLCSLIKHQALQVQHLITCTCPVTLPMLASS